MVYWILILINISNWKRLQRITVNICLKNDQLTIEKEHYLNCIEEIFKIFNLDKNLKLNVLDESSNSFHAQIELLNAKYRTDTNSIDFLKIINEFDFKNYDANLKNGHGIIY